MSEPRLVRFGTFEFDFSTRELRGNGRRVPLQGQPAQVLALLLSRSGQTVTREELRAAIWNEDTFVEFDTALNVAVNKIRQSLRDSASAPRFVETVPRHGYRFLADVHAIAPSPARPAAAAPPSPAAAAPAAIPAAAPANATAGRPARRRAAPAWIALAGAIAGVVVATIWRVAGVSGSPPPIRSVAVLPFRPLVAGAGDEVLEVGLAESVIIRLGHIEQLRVPSIHAVQRYARQQTDPRAAGRELGVEAVLEGSLLRANENIRFSARLLDVAKGTTLWAQQWDLPWSDIFTVQDAVALEVSRALAVRLASDGRALPGHPTNVAAFERYLRARYLLLRRTVADSKRAAELLEEAIALDPTSAAAHASLGFAYVSVAFAEGPRDPFVDKAREATRRALDLDPAIAEAHAVLGRIMLHFDLDVDAGLREMRRAFDLDPANPFVLHCYSLVLADEGRFDEALRVADRALAQEPTSVLATRDKAQILYLAGRYEESVVMSRRTLELDPYAQYVHSLLGWTYERLGREREAVEAHITPLTFSDKNHDVVAALRAVAARRGLRGLRETHLQDLLKKPDGRAYSIATMYMRLGDHDRALAWLDRLFEERGAGIRSLKVHPQWDPLRADPRFQALLRRARFAPAPSNGT
jgi:TolB-like protein/DNA-binding winged helix-turn-helix (wHTH) protein/Flp pilus assembly protein TadD